MHKILFEGYVIVLRILLMFCAIAARFYFTMFSRALEIFSELITNFLLSKLSRELTGNHDYSSYNN